MHNCSFTQVFLTQFVKPLKFEYVLPQTGKAYIGWSKYGDTTISEQLGYGDIKNSPPILSLNIQCKPTIARDNKYVVSKCFSTIHLGHDCNLTLNKILSDFKLDIKYDFVDIDTYTKEVQNGAFKHKIKVIESVGYSKTEILNVNIKEKDGILNGRMTKLLLR